MVNKSKRPSWFKLWLHHKPLIDAVPDDVVGRAVKASLCYFATGEVVPLGQLETAVFASIKSDIDVAHADYLRDVENGKKGGRPKRSDEKPPVMLGYSPLPMVTERDRDGERDGERDGDGEHINADKPPACDQSSSISMYKQRTPPDGHPFTSFWEAYPKKINREKAWQEWQKLNPTPQDAARILSTLEDWKKSGQWTEDGGRFIPDPANFLSKGYYNSTPSAAKKTEIPKGASGGLGEAEMAAIKKILCEES